MKRCFLLQVFLAAALAVAGAEVRAAGAETVPAESFEDAAADSSEAASAGLLSGSGAGWSWTAGGDAALAGFAYGKPIFTNKNPDPSGDLGGNWFETYLEPWFRGGVDVGRSRVSGEVSLLATWTGGAELGSNGEALLFEQAHLAWTSGDLWPGLGTDAFELRAGRFDFGLGTGMVLQLGGANGGERGDYYLAPRQTWSFGVVARFATGPHAVRAFYLDPDTLKPEEEARFAGFDYEIELSGGKVEPAVSWFQVFDAADSTREGLNVLSLRVLASPLGALPDLHLDGEVVSERNGDLLRAWAWYATAGYNFTAQPWAPSLRYRYAEFGGDDPGTTRSESFDPLRYGYTDYGDWYLGELYGTYLLTNSDLRSHQVMLRATPRQSLGLRLVFWDFALDRPAALESGAEVRHLGGEVDLIAEWALSPALSLTLVAASAWLDDLLQEEFGRSGALSYVMPCVTVSF